MFLLLTPRVTSLPLYLTGIGVAEPEGDLNRPKGLENHQIALVTQGEGELCLPMKSNLSTGDCFLLTKQTPHRYMTKEEPKMYTLWLLFDGPASDVLMERLSDGDGCGVIAPSEFFLLLAKAEAMLHQAENKPEPERLSAMLYDFLIELLRQKEGTDEKQSLVARLAPAMRYMEQHFAENVQLEEIAAAVCLSKFAFCKLFREAYRMTPFTYLMQLRLQHAKNILIQTPAKSVKEAALSSGFRDMSYFGTVFRRWEKMTPKEFQRWYGKG